ncbi:MAG: hypothetical protein C5B55_06510 [Blastocatellia bacterium]|nr:MAG: hypothetical protein C5B55_06510 [Blastocatellia bacterium]
MFHRARSKETVFIALAASVLIALSVCLPWLQGCRNAEHFAAFALVSFPPTHALANSANGRHETVSSKAKSVNETPPYGKSYCFDWNVVDQKFVIDNFSRAVSDLSKVHSNQQDRAPPLPL